MATRSVRISESLYSKIKASARKNKRTIRAQAEYWIQLGIAIDRQLQRAGWGKFFEGAMELSDLPPLGLFEKKIGNLITELRRFAENPSREGAKLCRAIINELQPLGDHDKLVAEFLEQAYQTVARPYRDAPQDIEKLISWTLTNQLARFFRR